VVGIALGVAAAVLITLAFVFFWCRHRTQATRKRSKRRSMYAQQTPPPPQDGGPKDKDFLSPPSRHSTDPSQRFYEGVPEDKRRSFWRRSIRPEEIGMAISPQANERSTPGSARSHQSMTALIPKVPPRPQSQSIWPASLRFTAASGIRRQSARPISEATIFDEDIEGQHDGTQRPSAELPGSFGNAKPGLSRPQAATLRLNPLVHGTANDTGAKKSAKGIPLTPTYDNGNISEDPDKSIRSGWPRASIASPPSAMQKSFLMEDDDDAVAKNRQKVLRKRGNVAPDPKSEDRISPRPEPAREESATTATTEIDDRSTSGESDRRLEQQRYPRSTNASVSEAVPMPQRSPISNLRYPVVPPSAALSRQAQVKPMPRLPLMAAPVLASPRSTRDALVRNNASFVITDTTSSDGYLSDQSIEWPVPPPTRSGPKTASQPKQTPTKQRDGLQNSTSGGNRGLTRPVRTSSLAQVVKSSAKPTGPVRFPEVPKAAPVLANGVPPTSVEGIDLYFRVEV
jgi:hypothetical protein